ncbi:MAG: flagellar hook-associated protein FlgK [Fimbriimonadales bacterium]
MSSFYGIELGTRALRAFQIGLEVTGHNVANVNTPGFSRRRVQFANTPEFAVNPRLRIGSGVMVQMVERMREMMLEQRINTQNADFARLDTLARSLQQVQSAFNEPGEFGINARLNAFFNAFEELATRPDSLASRQSVLQSASALVGTIRTLYDSLSTLENQAMTQAESLIGEANELAQQVARLNERIRSAQSTGAEAGDLLDQRDRLMSRLSELVGARAHYTSDGGIMVFVDGHTLVQDGASFPLPNAIDIANRTLTSTPVDIRIQSGALRGVMDTVANLQSYRADLNTFASTLITQVNALHSTGYSLNDTTGLLFFDGTDASNIALHADVSDPANIAASGLISTPGNNGVALALANLRNQPQAALGGASLTQYYRNLVGRVGNDAQVSRNRAETQQLSVEHLTNLRESISGVSLDEEAGKLVQYQRSYQAAARMVSSFDSLLQDVLQFVAPR